MLAPTNVSLLGTNLSSIHQPHVEARKIHNILQFSLIRKAFYEST